MLQYFIINEEEVKALVNTPLAPRQRAYHEIMWIQHGAANFLLDGDQYKVNSNAFFVLPKGRIHQFLPKETIKGQVIRFTPDLLDHYPRLLFSQFNLISQVTITPQDQQLFDDLYRVFKAEYSLQPPNSPILTHLLKAIIYKLDNIKQQQYNHLRTTNQTIDFEVFDDFQLLLDRYIREQPPIAFYAAQLNLSQRQLATIVKQIFNKPISVVIAERLLIESKRELVYTNQTISQIAYSLGFEDNSYFTKFFKKHTDQTPTSYRNQ